LVNRASYLTLWTATGRRVLFFDSKIAPCAQVN